MIAATLLAMTLSAAPDDPRRVPSDQKVYSPNRRYFLETHLAEKRTEVFETARPHVPLWEVAAFVEVPFLSNDGRHIAAEYAGVNILDSSVKPGDTLFTFYSPGQPGRVLSVGSVVGDIGKLPHTTSGHEWGYALYFDAKGWLVVMLVDRKTIRIDPDHPQRQG